MSDMAALLKAEISRIARKELRAELEPIRKSSSLYRSSIAALRRKVETLEGQLARARRAGGNSSRVQPAADEDTQDGPKLRFRPDGFATLRQKLGISAAQMGQLIGVTGQSIYAWETGKTRPRAGQLQAIAAVRKLGKREVMKRLESAE
jgi:DNA-binding XRE family transcriptional regulator